MAVLEVERLAKSFPSPEGGSTAVIDVPEFSVGDGERVALRGASGSGKTTFLNLVAGILTPDAGRVVVAGEEMTRLGERGRDALRARTIGYVFQAFNLLAGHTALENVELAMAFGGGVDTARARELLSRVGLAHRIGHRPRELSAGQCQRVAIARALANRPRLVLADEPTASLDAAHAREAIDLLAETCREAGAALLVVSHDEAVLARFPGVRDLSLVNRAGGAA